ncbi:MAG: DUF998 domain-containing protein [Candidatus Bathyarchaeota archaeon]|nr:MAG: DUF998 domain-containing protein [Candidatus Bathyarchaeota archaeon]
MKVEKKVVAGFLLCVGSVQCMLGIIVAEALHPGYSTGQNYISDLGVGPSSLIFNFSLIAIGVLGAVASYFIHHVFKRNSFTFLLMMGSIGAIGVGAFPENVRVVHTAFSLVVFLFTGLAAVWSYSVEEPPFAYLYAGLGGIALLALALFGTEIYLGLGRGGMERLIAYPELLWALSFGSRLSTHPLKPK